MQCSDNNERWACDVSSTSWSDPPVAGQLYTRLSLSYLSPHSSDCVAGQAATAERRRQSSAVSCLIQSVGRCGEFKGRKEELEPGFQRLTRGKSYISVSSELIVPDNCKYDREWSVE